jgi:hypothetical protein
MKDSGQAGMTEGVRFCKEIVKNVKHGIVINQGLRGYPPYPFKVKEEQ